MPDTTQTQEAFQALLEGAPAKASPQLRALVRLAAAIEPAPLPGPDPRFKTRLKSELLAQAAATEEDLFAAMLEGKLIAAPEELKPLVAVASGLAPASLPSPDIAFRYRLRNSLVTRTAKEASLTGRVSERVAAINARLRKSLRVVAATGMAATMMLGGSAAMAAASNALPGDPLYGLKQWKESAELTVISGDREGVRLISFARTRLAEVRALDARGEMDQRLYEDTLADMDSLTTQAAEIIIAGFRSRDGREPEAIKTLTSFAQTQRLHLTRLLDTLPPAVRPSALDSIAVAESVETRASIVLVNPACPCPDAPLAPSVDEDAPSAVGCACDPSREPASQTTQADDPPAKKDEGGSDDPKPEDPEDPDDPEEPDEDDAVDVPDVDGTEVDDEAEDLINDLIDDLGGLPPLPLPSPSTSPLGVGSL